MKKRWVIAIVYLLLIHTLSSFSFGNSKVEFFYGFDKIIHFFEYFLLTFFLWQPINSFFNLTSINSISLGIFVFSALNGLLDEYHQEFVYGRASSYGDMLADVIGSGCSIIYLRFTHKNNSFSNTKFEENLESN